MDTITETHGRKLATIQKISKLSPIENSDFLEVAEMENLGWKVVVKKGELNVGELVVYFEIDSAIRLKNLIQPLEFLKDKCLRKICDKHGNVMEELVRIKTIKLRGVISQGLIVPWSAPIDQYPTGEPKYIMDFIGGETLAPFDVGKDLTAAFHVEHFDEIRDYFDTILGVNVQSGCKRASDFPCWVPKTDEDRLQNCMDFFTKYAHDDFEVTEKFDGSSMTAIYAPTKRPDKPFYLCSRKFELDFDETSEWWKPIIQSNLQEKMKELYETPNGEFTGVELAIQGEIVGPKFNKNRDRYTEVHWKVFRIFDVTHQKFVDPFKRYKICHLLGLEHVKVMVKSCKIFEVCKNLDSFLSYVEGQTDHGLPREGMVFKKVDDGSVSFKVINNQYLLKEKD